MPLDKKSADMKRNFDDTYGEGGDRVFYATLNKAINKGKPYKVGESKKLAAKRKYHKKKKKLHAKKKLR